MEYKYTAVVIGKRDVGEMDRIYSLYTLEQGKIQTLAKSVRKNGAKLAGLLENFTYGDISIARSRGMGKVTGSIVERNFTHLKKDYDALAVAMRALNMFDSIVDLEHRDSRAFDLLLEFLETIDALSQKKCPSEERRSFMLMSSVCFSLKLLDLLGYRIEVGHCVDCKEKLSAQDVFFSASLGGMLCKTCATGGKNGNLARLSVNALKAMRLCFGNPVKSLAKVKVSDRDIRLLQGMLSQFLVWIR